jgi:hypothetical protein
MEIHCFFEETAVSGIGEVGLKSFLLRNQNTDHESQH